MKKISSVMLSIFLSFFLLNTQAFAQLNSSIDFFSNEKEECILKRKEVLVLDSTDYVSDDSIENRGIITQIAIFIYIYGTPILVGHLASNGGLIYTGNYPPGLKAEAVRKIMSAWNTYQDMAEVYLNDNQNIQSFKLSNGNECIPVGSTYACMWSLRE